MESMPTGHNQNFEAASHSLYYKLIRLLHLFIVSIKKNIWLFIICMLVGIVPLILKNRGDAQHYKASFTVSYDELFRKIYGDRLGKINSLIGRQQYEKVAVALQVPLATASTLVKVEGKNILGEDLSKDLNTDRIPFIVNIIVKDSSAVTSLQNGLVGFLETGNEFLADRKAVKVLETKEELEYVESQMHTMDSLNRRGVFSTGSTAKTDDKAANSLFEFSYELYKRKQELLRKQRMPSSLMVVDDAIVSTAAQRSILIVIAMGAVIGLFLFVALVWFVIPAFRFKEEVA